MSGEANQWVGEMLLKTRVAKACENSKALAAGGSFLVLF